MGWMGWSVIDDAELARLRAVDVAAQRAGSEGTSEGSSVETCEDDTRPLGRKFANQHVERVMRDERLVRGGLRALWAILDRPGARERLGLSAEHHRALCAFAGVSAKE
jgi:hypothetical protein